MTVTREERAVTRHHPGHNGFTPACLSETLDRQRSPEVNLVRLMRLQDPARRRLLLNVTIGTHPDDDASGSEGLVGKLVQLRLIRKNRFHVAP